MLLALQAVVQQGPIRHIDPDVEFPHDALGILLESILGILLDRVDKAEAKPKIQSDTGAVGRFWEGGGGN